MKKKIVMLFMAVSMMLSLVACGTDSDNSSNSKTNTESVSNDCPKCDREAKCSCGAKATICGYAIGGARHFCDSCWKTYETVAGEHDSVVRKKHEIYGR